VATAGLGDYAVGGIGRGPIRNPGEAHMQSTRPRDLGVLALVIGLFLVLFVVTLILGSPAR
jgi:hypothetical protein